MNNAKFRKVLSLVTASTLISAMVLSSCTFIQTETAAEETTAASETTTETTETTVATTTSETTEATTTATEETSATTSETTAALPQNDEISKLKNVNGNVWINEDAQYSAVVNELLKQTDKGAISGSLIVATDTDVIFASGTGLKDINGKEVTPYTTYEAGSISKSFAAVCIMKLVEDGKLTLNTTLGEIFPEYKNCKRFDKNSKITVSDLLYMRSGIPDDPVKFFGVDLALSYVQDENRTPEESQRDFYKKVEGKTYMECLFSCELGFDPGTQYEFADANYYILALIVEDVAGMPYEDYVNKVILAPCAMTSSSSMAYGDITAALPKDTFYNPFEGSMGAKDIHSTVTDILNFDRALFGGKLLKSDTSKVLLTPADTYAGGWTVETNGLYHCESDTFAFHGHNYVFEQNGKRYYVIMFTALGDKSPENVWKSISPLLGK